MTQRWKNGCGPDQNAEEKRKTVNANEAETRRRSRFFAFGHTPGTRLTPPTELRPEAPLTLDLRQTVSAPPARELLIKNTTTDNRVFGKLAAAAGPEVSVELEERLRR